MGARCGLRGQGQAAHSGGTLVHALPTCWLCHALQVLGTPTLEEIQAMNQNYTEYKFPQARARPHSKPQPPPFPCANRAPRTFPRCPARLAGQAAPVAQGLPPPHAVGRHRAGLALLALFARLAHQAPRGLRDALLR